MSGEPRIAQLGSDESTFLISSSEDSLWADVPADNTLVEFDTDTDSPGLWVSTGSQWGPFQVETRTTDGPPSVEALWEDVVEFSVRFEGALVVSELVDREPVAQVADVAGGYRLRVCARGRTESADRDAKIDLDEESEDPAALEHYLIEAWPAPVQAPRIVRLDSAFAHTQLDPDQDKPFAEQLAGVAAAASIGRDLTGEPNCRTLSGRRGALEVSRVIAGDRGRLFQMFAHCAGWHDGYSSWGGIAVRPGDRFYSSTRPVEHGGDGLTGLDGQIEHMWVEVQKPTKIVRSWQWQHSGPATRLNDRAIRNARVASSSPTLLTIILSQGRDDVGQPTTQIRISHENLPIEWIHDMAAYWRSHLAIAESRGYGIR